MLHVKQCQMAEQSPSLSVADAQSKSQREKEESRV